MVRSKAFPFPRPQEACMPQAFKIVQILYTVRVRFLSEDLELAAHG